MNANKKRYNEIEPETLPSSDSSVLPKNDNPFVYAFRVFMLFLFYIVISFKILESLDRGDEALVVVYTAAMFVVGIVAGVLLLREHGKKFLSIVFLLLPALLFGLLRYHIYHNDGSLYSNSWLHTAIEREDVKRINRVIRRNDIPESLIHEALKAAVKNKSRISIKALVENGADVNRRDEYGYTPYMNTENKDIKDYLVSLGAYRIDWDEQGLTELHRAAKSNDTATIRRILDDGYYFIDLSINSLSPLTISIMFGNKEAAEMLIKNGANVNIRGDRGVSPLMHAVANIDLIKMAELLIDAGADVNCRASYIHQQTPLTLAMTYKNLPAIKLLIKSGAEPRGDEYFNSLNSTTAEIRQLMEQSFPKEELLR